MSILFGTHLGEYTRLQPLLFMHVGGKAQSNKYTMQAHKKIGIAIDELLYAS